MARNNILEAGGPGSAVMEGQMNPPPRILVADDEPSIRRLITDSLAHSGYEVDAAEDGAAAWDALQPKRYDLLITANSRPKITGIELVKRRRGKGVCLPIVIVSAVIPTADFDQHPELQISAVLVKPFAMA